MNWHWDEDRKRWVIMGNEYSHNPQYNWELRKDQLVYSNELMCEAIEVALNNMERYPDAENILRKFMK